MSSSPEALRRRIAALDPERRAHFEAQLKARGLRLDTPDGIRRRAHDKERPLSLAQERILIDDARHDTSARYNECRVFSLRGPGLNAEALARSLTEIVRRHEVLRCRFEFTEEGPVQHLVPCAPFELPYTDLSDLPASERDTRGAAIEAQEATTRVDPTASPLLRAHLLRLEEDHHRLIVVAHHIVCDAWSLRVFLDEAIRAYRGESLPELELSYADFADWQRRTLGTPKLEAQLAHWRKRLLQPKTPGLLLAPDRPRPAHPTHRGERVPFTLSAACAHRLDEVARGAGATTFVALLTVLKALLCRISGESDIAVGTLNANREDPALAPLIGFFVNTLVLRTNLQGDPTYRQAVQRVRDVTFEAYAHQDVPFDVLVKALQPERSAHRAPFFQVEFLYDPVAESPAQADTLSLSSYEVHNRGAKFDLLVDMRRGSKGEICGFVEYAADVFEHATMVRLVDQLEGVATAASKAPDQPLSALVVPTDRDRAQLWAWNQTTRVRALATAHGLFERRVDLGPELDAVVDGAERVTYAELDRRANRLARRLQSLGVGAEDRVGVWIPRSTAMVTALLAVHKAGAAYVPLDPDYPAERLAAFVRASTPKVLLVLGVAPPRLMQEHCGPVLDLGAPSPPHVSSDRPCVRVDPHQLAYVVFTSGSTGQPKGVMISHAALCNHNLWMQDTFPLDAQDRFLHKTSIGFDVAAFELFWPLCAGAALVLARPGGHRDPAYIVDLVQRERVTALYFVASMLTEFMDAEDDVEGCETLRLVFSGGEALTRSTHDRVYARLPAVELHNLYGPTEATIDVTHWPCRARARYASVPIGRALHNTQLYVLDAQLRPVPIGAPGRLYVGGAALARGYVAAPGLTAERFVPSPFAELPGDRLYDTGDLVRFRHDGALQYLGRADSQVKVRGQRIELSEIEHALRQHPGVREAAVDLRTSRAGDRRLAAYFVTAEVAPSPSDLAAHLRALLQQAMVPAWFTQVDSIPRTPNGKLDRAGLPDPETSQCEAEPPVAPSSRTERLLHEIWGRVLGNESLSVHDNFFQAGGDSILALQIVSRARRAGLTIPLQNLFVHQTVYELAAALDAQGPAPAPISAPIVQALAPGAKQAIEPTPMAARYLRLDPQLRARFHLAAVVRLPKDVDRAHLQEALARVWRSHETLRLTVDPASLPARPDLRTAQIGAPPTLLVSEPRDPDDPDWPQTLERVRAGLDLRSGQSCALGLVPGRSGTAHLVWFVHHLAADAVSLQVLIDDLSEAYAAVREGRQNLLAPVPCTASQWARRLMQWARGPDASAQTEHWTPRLDDPLAQALLPRSGGGSAIRLSHAPHSAGAFQAAAAHYEVDVQVLFLAALGLALRRTFEVDTPHLMLERHGRDTDQPDLDGSRTVGWLTALVPIRLEFANIERASDAVAVVQRELASLPHPLSGYGALREYATPPEWAARPEPSVAFNFLGRISQRAGDDFVMTMHTPPADPDRAGPHRFSLEIDSALVDDRLEARLTSTALPEERLRRLADAWQGAIEELGLSSSQAAQPTVLRSYPVSITQEGLLFHALRAPQSGAFVQQLACRLRGPLNAAGFDAAWRAVIAHHELLRTTFRFGDGHTRSLQDVHARGVLEITRQDWRAMAGPARDARFAAWLDTDRHRGFDPQQLPLMRLALFDVAYDERWLVWTFHHVLMDGWCMPRLLEQVFTCYEAALRGHAPHLPPAISYERFVTWQDARDAATDEAIWRQRLKGSSGPTHIPSRRPRAPAPGPGQRDRRFSADASARVVVGARQARVTVATMVQGAWALVLSRLADEPDVLFGVTTAGRSETLEGADQIIGPCMNTVPLRVRVEGPNRVDAWLASLQLNLQESAPYAHAPLPSIARWAGLGGRVIESGVVVENYPIGDVLVTEHDGLRIDEARAYEQTDLPLTLVVVPGQRMQAMLLFDGLTYDASAADRVLTLFEATLEGLAAHLDGCLEDIDWTALAPRPSCELTSLAPGPRLLHERFASWAQRQPDAVALSCQGRHLSYGVLHQQATLFAGVLRARGLRPGEPVGLFTARAFEMVIGMLAVLEAGGAYLPLDPGHPAARIRTALEDSRARWLLADRDPTLHLGEVAAQVVRLDEPEAVPDAEPQGAPELDPSCAAYVIYTSGSTGRPKGVVITHDNICRHLDVIPARYGFDSSDVFTVFHSYAFDFSVWEIWAALSSGARLVIVPEATTHAPEQLYDLLAREQVTVLTQTPSSFAGLMTHALDATLPLDTLRWLFLGGEPLDFASLGPWFDRYGDEHPKVVNVYGPTECTVAVTHRRITAADAHADLGSRLGSPLGWSELFVVDRRGRALPEGVRGEIVVAGPGVGAGYLARPRLTAECFRPDGLTGARGRRLYHTGDVGQWVDGELEYLGRRDRQVKIRGYRLELEELETALTSLDGVREAAVIAAGPSPSAQHLVAYLCFEPGQVRDPSELRTQLRQRLPSYMVPSVFVTMETLPRNASDKIDRLALPAPQALGHTRAPSGPPPTTPQEKILASAFAEVLEVDEVGLDDDFFDLGGDSIRSIRIAAIAKRHGLSISLADLYSRPTIRALAAEAPAVRAETRPEPHASPALPPSVEATFPATRLQLGMLFHAAESPQEALYHDVIALDVEAPHLGQHLFEALTRVMAAHPTLRARFDLPTQRLLVQERVDPPLTVEAVAPQAEEAWQARVDAALEAAAQHRFDPARAPLFRLHVLQRTDGRLGLVLSSHHAIVDGWSIATLLTELFLHAAALEGGAPAPPPPRLNGPAEVAAAEARSLAQSEHRGFWDALLDGATAPRLPAGLERHRGHARAERALSPALSDKLTDFAKRLHVPRRTLFLAAHLATLRRWVGARDLVTGVVTHNRPEAEDGDRLLGLFLNTLPLRLHVPTDATWRSLAGAVLELERRVLPHRGHPLHEILRRHGLTLETCFNYVDFHVYDRATAHGAVRVRRAASRDRTHFALEIGVRPGAVEVSTRGLDEHIAERVAADFLDALEAMVATPDARLDATLTPTPPVLRPPPPAPESVIDRFVRQAQARPRAVALVDGPTSLDYGTLRERAGRLATELRRRGLGPESVVLVQVSCAADWATTFWGVLEAGAVYWPVAPDEPQERLQSSVALLQPQLHLTRGAASAAVASPHLDIGALPEAPPPESSAPHAQTLAYVMLTSGTTGQAKAVGVPRGALDRIVDFHIEALDLDTHARILQFARPWVDASIPELIAIHAAGGCAVAPNESSRVGPALVDLLGRQSVSHAILPPSIWARTDPALLPKLRIAAAGGEACASGVVERWAPGRRFLNLYGPTEATVDATMHVCDASGGAPPIGRAVPGTDAFVLSEQGQALPAGAVGEIYLGGSLLARGYLGQAGATADRFVPSPFGPPGARLYRTGDLGRVDAQGYLHWLGRTDRQIELAGVRVEPAEVEAVLESVPGVAEAAVVTLPGPRPQLLAYVVARSTDARQEGPLRARLHASLPAAFHPSSLTWVDALPHTSRGKVDYRELARWPAPSTPVPSAPPTGLARVLAAIWSDVLDGAPVGGSDDLIALGGDSLAALEIASRVEGLLARRVSVRTVLEAKTVYGLAKQLQGGDAPRLPIQKWANSAEPAPLSAAQERLWFLHQMDPGGYDYNVPSAVRLRGAVDREALQQALDDLTHRQDILRTVIEDHDGRPLQRVSPDLSLRLRVRRVASSDLQTALCRAARRPFDLERGPPVRAELYELSEHEHVLLVVVHHMACDGASTAILVRELVALYEAATHRGAAQLPPLAIHYADYARHERRPEAQAEVLRAVAEAAQRLAGASTHFELPLDRPHMPGMRPRGATHVLGLPAEQRTRVEATARAHSVTPFMFLAGAFAALLARYADSDEVLIGYPSSGRGTPELDALIGYFVDTRVLRVASTGSVEHMLGEIKASVLASLAGPSVPLDRLMDALDHPRGPGAPPLVRALLSYHERQDLPDLSGLRWSPVAVDIGTAKADLALAVQEEDQGWRLTLEYDACVFDVSTIERMAQRFVRLTAEMAAWPQREVRQLRIEDGVSAPRPAPRHDATVGHPRETVVARLHRIAGEHPDREAVVAADERLTYAELQVRARTLAGQLRTQGVRSGRGVGVLMQRSVDRVVALVAILEAGGYYMGFDLDTPPERISKATGVSDVAVWVVDELGADLVPQDASVLRAGAPSGSAAPVAPQVYPSDPAYVSFTSGTTGRPKGVLVPHEAIVRLADGVAQLGELGIVLHHSSIAFDASTLELWAPLLTGGTVAVAPPGPFDAAELGAMLRSEDVRTLWLSAGLFHRIVDDRPAVLEDIGMLFAGGDVLSPPHVERALRALRGGKLFNGYGPTEATTFTTCARLDVEDASRGVVPIGQPLAGTEVYLLDDRLRPVSQGAVGELYVGGPGVALGYALEPRSTAERFLPDPHVGTPGARMYRTGDFAFVDGSRRLRFVGRRDAQVKIRGYRVEPSEVQAFLLSHPSVRDCAVVVEDGRGGERQLAAYVVTSAPVSEVRDHCDHGLPTYMRPARIEAVSTLPLNPSGKIDRKRLAGAPTTPSSGETSEDLSQIWCELLGVCSVAPDDDFFELGGHSLLAAQLSSRIRDRLGRQLPLRDIFTAPTFGALRARVEAARTVPSAPHLFPKAVGPAPLTPGQARLWAFERLRPGTATYNVPLVLRLEGALDLQALERAVAGLSERHKILRCRVDNTSSTPVLRETTGPMLTLSQRAAGSEASLRDEVQDYLQSPFDLEHQPCWRVRVWRQREDEHVLAIVLHHIVCDGPSLDRLLGELEALYAAAKAGLPPALVPLPAQYADFAASRGRDASGPDRARHEAHWRSALEGAPSRIDLPRAARRAPRPDAARELRRTINPALREGMDRVARQFGTTAHAFGLAALGVLLSRFCDAPEVVVACPINHRPHPNFEPLIGMFVDVVPIRIDVADDPSFSTLLGRVHTALIDALEHTAVPWDEVWPDRTAPNVLYTNDGMSPTPAQLEGLRVSPLPSPPTTADQDLVVVLPAQRESNVLRWVHREDGLDAEIAPVIADCYLSLLNSAVQTPNARTLDLIMSPEPMESEP